MKSPFVRIPAIREGGHRFRPVIVIAIILFIHAGTAICSSDDSKAEQAFAVVSGLKGSHYPSFYSYFIAPQAVVEKGQVFCAYQDSSGRPIVLIYDIKNEDWCEPVRVSEFGLKHDSHGNPAICIDRRLGRVPRKRMLLYSAREKSFLESNA